MLKILLVVTLNFADINDLKEVQFFIVAVPTPIDEICPILNRLLVPVKQLEAY